MTNAFLTQAMNGVKLWTMGLMLAAIVIIAKQLIAIGFHPIQLAFMQAAGSALYLSLFGFPSLSEALRKHWHYFLLASLLGFTFPQLLVFYSVEHVGVGIASLSYALPIIVTYLISLSIGIEHFRFYSLCVLSMVVAGTFIYLFRPANLEASIPVYPWLLILGLAPISVGIANVYRTLKWPKNMQPIHVALLTNIFSGSCYLLIMLTLQPELPQTDNITTQMAFLISVLLVLSGACQHFLFSLHRTASPIFIGQTGSITTLFGGLLGFLLFDEAYQVNTLLGSILILLGVALYSRSKSSSPVQKQSEA